MRAIERVGLARRTAVLSSEPKETQQISSRLRIPNQSTQNTPVERVIRVTSLTNSTVEGVGDVGSSHLSLVVNLGNVDLNRGVVLGGDEAVGRRALAGDVKVDNLAL